MENTIDSDDDKTISIGARMAEMSAHLRILLNREQKWIEGQNDLKEMILNQQDQINSIINGGSTTSPVPTSNWEKTFMEALPTDGPAKFSGNGKKVPEFLASVETVNEVNNGIQEEPLSDVHKLRQQMVQLQAKVNKIGAAPKPKNN